MIILDSTSRSLEGKLAGAITTNHVRFVVSYVDILDSDQSVSDIAFNSIQDNGGTAVTLVSAPAASHTRQVKQICVVNKDTASIVVIIQVNEGGGTLSEVHRATYLTGETMYYQD